MNIVFLNVDTQKDFMNKDGKLCINNADRIKPQLNRLTQYAHKNNIKVVNTQDFHLNNASEFKKFPPHCIAGTDGAEFIEETDPKFLDHSYCIVGCKETNLRGQSLRARNIILQKDHFDVFKGNKSSELIFKLLKPDLIIVYGVSGDCCVDYAIKGLIRRKYNVAVVYDAIRSIEETPFEKWVRLGVMVASTNILFLEII